MHPISYERKKLKAMQRYLMNFDTRRLPRYEADALVIGSGVAGLTAAWHLAQAGKSVLLAVRDTLFDSNTNKAQGGIAASFGSDDNPELHLEDTLVAGAGHSSPHSPDAPRFIPSFFRTPSWHRSSTPTRCR